MKKYIIVLSLTSRAQLVYRVTAHNSENAVIAALRELSEYQLSLLENIQIINEVEFKEIKE